MSVGVQRLREEPDRIRQGAIDKREDPALVDQAHRGRRAPTPAPVRVGQPQGRAQRGIEADRRGHSRRRASGWTRGGPAACRLDGGRRPHRRDRRRAVRGRGRARGAAPAHPQPRGPRGPRRRRGRQRHGPDMGRERQPRSVGRGWHHLGAQAPLGDRRGPRHHRQPARRQDRRLRVPGLQGRGLAAPAQPHLLVPRRPHRRARLHRGLAAGGRERCVRARHRPDPGQGRPDVRRHA